MGIFDWFKGAAPGPGPWILVGAGSPDLASLETRGNLGRQMLLRAAVDRGRMDIPSERLPSGVLYHSRETLKVLMPEVPPERTGQACLEAVAQGHAPDRLILVAPDLRLPAGVGRLRLSGLGGHEAVRSAMRALRTRRVARLVLGIGPLTAPKAAFLAERWPSQAWEKLDALEAPFLRFLDRLAESERLGALAEEVNQLAFWQG